MNGATSLGVGSRAHAWETRLLRIGRTHGALVTLLVLVLLNCVFTRNFASANNFWNVLFQVSPTVIVSVGMALVIATNGIDLSVGSVMAVSSAVAALSIDRGAGAALLAGLTAGAALGMLNGLLVTRFGIQPFMSSLALLISGRGLAQVLCNEGELISFANPAFELLGRGHVGPAPLPVVLAAAVVVLAVFTIRKTSFGRYVLAAGGNGAAAHLAGVPVHTTLLVVYTLSGFLAGFAGLIETARLGATDPSNMGGGMEFAAIAAVVIGGTPFSGGRVTLLGTVFGALLMAVIATGLNMLQVSYAWTLLIQAFIILLAVAIQGLRVN